jgi:acyl carrier protein
MTAANSPSTELRDDVVATVRGCIAEALAVDLDKVTLDSRLIDDLGADSLDFVDIIFQLDHALDIKVRESEFNFITRLDFSSPEVMKEGYLAADVVEQLESWLPPLRALEDKSKVTPQELFGLISVEAICIVASRRLDARTATP